MVRQARGTAEGKRRNYSLKFKLDVLREYAPNTKGKGFVALSQKYGVPRSTLRGWWIARDGLKASLKDERCLTRMSRRLKGGGRKPLHQVMEQELHSWILERNQKGLRVKDQYISRMALKILERISANNEDSEDSRPIFKASAGWLDRFKKRYNLGSRRHTTDRVLPENAAELCRLFIQECQELIDTHQIKPRNIINLDQVPRYYETEPKSTICTRGSRTILMRKGGTSHKRFTIGFFITAEGKHLSPHILVSKRTTKPNVPLGCYVDVNKTGMWSREICWEYFKATILNRPCTRISREPTLYLIDAYGPHLNWPKEHARTLEDHNIHVRIVPAALTSVLQPLDVAVNRSYQVDYGTKYDSYIGEALVSPALQTKQGNPKCPTVKMVVEWALEWIKRQNEKPEDIANAFKVCGLVPSAEFKVDNLHPPLKAFYAADVHLIEWLAEYGDLLKECSEDREILEIGRPDWFLPEDDYLVFRCIIRSKGLLGSELDDALDSYIMDITLNMIEMPELEDLFDDDDDAADLVSGEMATGTLDYILTLQGLQDEPAQ